jgi:L-Ala-D/L-Glu epimerase
MRIESAELHFLEIPFRLSISHGARAGRTVSDSLVLRVTSRGRDGYGEAVVRDYVSGSLGTGSAFQAEAARITSGFLDPLRGRDFSWGEARSHLAALSCPTSALPLLCAVESALLACAVEEEGLDPYAILSMEPARTTVVYGATLPMFPIEVARAYIEQCAALAMTNLKVKVGPDPAYNDAVLALCRRLLGADVDMRVDVNTAWAGIDLGPQMEICSRHGVRVIEQPFPADSGDGTAAARLVKAGFLIMADEGVLTPDDVDALASSGTAQMLNLRLSKNGGLSRLLALAHAAEERGLSYQLGCMVGETGILSSLGRLAASLLPRPVYLEGSYDEILLGRNITKPGFGFGRGGKAQVTRQPGIGYAVDETALRELSRASLPV